jgi:hypothetical protein
MDRASEHAQKYLQKNELSGEALKEALNILDWNAQREKGVLLYVEKLLPGNKGINTSVTRYIRLISRHVEYSKKYVQDFYDELCSQRGKKPKPWITTEEEKLASRLTPVRNPKYPGPIQTNFVNMMLEEEGLTYKIPFRGNQLYEINAFIDGSRSVLDIRNAVSAEYGPLKLLDVLKYLRVLEKIRLVTFKK